MKSIRTMRNRLCLTRLSPCSLPFFPRRPAFAPIYSNQYAPLAGGQGVNAVGTGAGSYASSSQYGGAGGSSGTNKRDNESLSSRKEKRQYKKRKQKLQKDRGLSSGGAGSGSGGVPGGRGDAAGGSSSGSGLGNSASHHHLHPQQQLHYHGSMVGGIGGRGVDGTVSGGHGTGMLAFGGVFIRTGESSV